MNNSVKNKLKEILNTFLNKVSYNYIAVNAAGSVFAFEEEPVCGSLIWIPKKGTKKADLNIRLKLHKTDWKTTCVKCEKKDIDSKIYQVFADKSLGTVPGYIEPKVHNIAICYLANQINPSNYLNKEVKVSNNGTQWYKRILISVLPFKCDKKFICQHLDYQDTRAFSPWRYLIDPSETEM